MKEMMNEKVRTALELLEKGDVKTGEEMLRQAADAGDAEACRILAREYRHEFHFSGDDDYHYQRLAILAASGNDKSVPKNRIQAAEWLKPVQDDPMADAVCRLFGLLDRKIEYEAVIEYMMKEMSSGPDGKTDVDILYIHLMILSVLATRVPRDKPEASEPCCNQIYLLSYRLAEQNSLASTPILSQLLENSDEDGGDIEAMIIRLLEQGVERNDSDNMYYLGRYLLKHGETERGEELIRKAAAMENHTAMAFVVEMDLKKGADPEEILVTLEKCIEEGVDEAYLPAAKLCARTEDPKALEYVRKAAELGNTEAMIMLGRIYQNGKYVEKDLPTAFRYFSDAAEKGDVTAHLHLGLALLEGNGTAPDPFAAFGHLLYCVQSSGNRDAEMHLGILLLNGIGCVQDREQGMKYLVQSMEHGCPEAACYWFLEMMDEAQNWTNEQQHDALRKLKTAAETGSAMAQTLCGTLLGDTEPEKAAELFKLASDQGDSEAAYRLGLMYLHGIGVKRDEQAAREYLSAAAERGEEPKAMFELGKLCLKEKDYIKAFQYFSSASGKNHAEATLELAKMYEKGLGMPKDKDRGMKLRSHAEELMAQGE